jgi:hypothetical protein
VSAARPRLRIYRHNPSSPSLIIHTQAEEEEIESLKRMYICFFCAHTHTHTHAHSHTRTHTYTPGQLAAVTGLGIAQADEMLDRAGATFSQTSSLW